MREALQQPPPGAAELPTAEGLLQRRLKHLDLGLAVLCWLVGAGLALSGLIRALQADGQPNTSLLVLAAGVAVLLLAARGGAGRWLPGPRTRSWTSGETASRLTVTSLMGRAHSASSRASSTRVAFVTKRTS